MSLSKNLGYESPNALWHCRCNAVLARGPACGVCSPDFVSNTPQTQCNFHLLSTLDFRVSYTRSGIYTRVRWALSRTDECRVVPHAEIALKLLRQREVSHGKPRRPVVRIPAAARG